VGRWLLDLRATLGELAEEGRVVVVAGGTGLYF